MKYKGEVHLGTTRYITLVTSFFFLEFFLPPFQTSKKISLFLVFKNLVIIFNLLSTTQK